MKQSISDHVDPRQLGAYIKRARLRSGLSIRSLAAAAGVDFSWLSRLERGDYTNPDPRHLSQVALALEIDVADLYVLAGYRSGEGLPGFAPYLRAKYDLPPEAIEQLNTHFELINERYGKGEGDARDRH